MVSALKLRSRLERKERKNPHQSAPNDISIGSAVFAHLTPGAKHTDIQTTLRATSVAIGHLYALRAGDVA